MTPLSMPELMETLNEHLTPTTEEQAAQYQAPTAPYIRALAEQVRPWRDPSLNQVYPKYQPRFQFWISTGRTKPAPSEKFAVQNLQRHTSSSSRHGGGKSGKNALHKRGGRTEGIAEMYA